MALPEMIILLLLFLRLFPLALDRQYAVGHLDLDVLLIDPRQVGVDFVGVVFSTKSTAGTATQDFAILNIGSLRRQLASLQRLSAFR